MDPATSLQTAEQALRDVIRTVFAKEHGPNWVDVVVDQETRDRWRDVRAKEVRQRHGHALTGVSDIDYAFLGDLAELIKRKGHWQRLFAPIFGEKDATFALLALLERVRRPASHARTLQPFEEDLASGISGYLRKRVTLYLSSQDDGGDYYPRVERIEDSFGNSFVTTEHTNHNDVHYFQTATRLTVGDEVTFRCQATDPQGRRLSWRFANRVMSDVIGDKVELSHRMSNSNTGRCQLLIVLNSDGPYHRNVLGGQDAVVAFIYRVVPPQ